MGELKFEKGGFNLVPKSDTVVTGGATLVTYNDILKHHQRPNVEN